MNLCFVDTPGFDDTIKSDLDILKLIAKWLSGTYVTINDFFCSCDDRLPYRSCASRFRLAGLLYFHRISDNRMAGTSLKNFHLFEQLCGKDFRNIVLTTTMWDDVDEPVGAAREQELMKDYWRPMLERGSSVKRFLYTPESAFDILASIFDDVTERNPLLIRKEMNDSGLLLKETSAGKLLKMELGELAARNQEALERIRRELRDPTVDADQLRFLMEDYQKAYMQLQCATKDKRKMKISAVDRLIHPFRKRLVLTSIYTAELMYCHFQHFIFRQGGY